MLAGGNLYEGLWQLFGGLSASTHQVINLSIQAGSGGHGMSLLIPWPANCCVLWFVKMSGRKKNQHPYWSLETLIEQ